MPNSDDILKSLQSIERAIWATQQKPELKPALPSMRPAVPDAPGAAVVLFDALVGGSVSSASVQTSPGELVLVGARWSVSGVPVFQHTLKLQVSFNGADWYDVRSDTLSGSGSYVLEARAAFYVRASVSSTGTEGTGIGYALRVEVWHGKS